MTTRREFYETVPIQNADIPRRLRTLFDLASQLQVDLSTTVVPVVSVELDDEGTAPSETPSAVGGIQAAPGAGLRSFLEVTAGSRPLVVDRIIADTGGTQLWASPSGVAAVVLGGGGSETALTEVSRDPSAGAATYTARRGTSNPAGGGTDAPTATGFPLVMDNGAAPQVNVELDVVILPGTVWFVMTESNVFLNALLLVREIG